MIALAKKKKLAVKRPALARAAPTEEFPEDLRSKLTLLFLVALFTSLAMLIYFSVIPESAIYLTLVTIAVIWCLAEFRLNRNDVGAVKRAFLVGLFLMVFDFAFQNSGWLLGLWATHGAILAVGVVPIEVMLICLIGGTAWALYLPRSYDRMHSIMDILVFATYGTLGEYMFRLSGLMSYYQWWNAGLAFLAYGITWVILHYVKYRVVKV